MNKSKKRLETLVLHGGYEPEATTGATTPTIFQSTSFAYKTAEALESVFAGREVGYIYSRIGNPTVTLLERRVYALEEGLGAVACASGMSAITATILALAGSGDEILSGNSIFGGTYSLFQQTLSRYGITVRFVESTDIDAYRKNVTPRTKAIFVETIGNPKLDVPDIEAISMVAREHGIVLVVDNTVTTPILFKPKIYGANIVIHSASKFINGHGNTIGGIILDCGTFDWNNSRYQHLQNMYKSFGEMTFLAYVRSQICRDLGLCLSPFNAFLLATGIETLALRMERHCSNALYLAKKLKKHPKICELRYPGLEDHPNHIVATRQFHGRYGGLLTLTLENREQCFRFINGLELIQNLANLGDAKTLVIHPASTFCRDLSEEQRRAVGVTESLVRLSIGIEHPDDILEDIENSLTKL